MVNTLFLPEIREMLAENNQHELREFCKAIHPVGTAEFMGGLTPDESWRVLQFADEQTRGEIFLYFDHDRQIELIQQRDRKEVADLIAHMAHDDRVDLLKEVDVTVVDELLELLPSDDRRDILRLRAHPEDTAGAHMTTAMAKLPEDLTVQDALHELQTQSEDLETIYYLYIVDESGHLRGVVSTRQLISSLGKPDTKLGDIMETELITVNINDDQEDVAQKVARYDLLAIPVVDDQYRLQGIITYDDVIDVVVEEAVEDAHRIGGVDPLERSYLRTDILTLGWKRGVWLAVLFMFALMTAYILKTYQEQLDKWDWLVYFIPLVISSGGNSGNQSATLIITALVRNDIEVGDWRPVVWRELLCGLLLGGFLAAMSLLAVYGIRGPDEMSWSTVCVLPLTVILVVLCGTLLGSILPLVFQRFGLDPALMSNPFVAGLVDIIGIVIYINVAILLLT